MKKKLLVCSLIAICIAIASFGTVAYFSYEDKATNVITAGDVKIDIIDRTDGDAFDGNLNVMPATSVKMSPTVKNVGSQSAWVRISVSKQMELSYGDADLSLIVLNYDTEHWAEKDGYFYYLSELKSGESTQPLFTEVGFSKYMTNIYQNGKAIISVTAEATQRANNSDSVFEADGWPVKD